MYKRKILYWLSVIGFWIIFMAAAIGFNVFVNMLLGMY